LGKRGSFPFSSTFLGIAQTPKLSNEEKAMLAILGEYLQNLNSEIESYEKLIAEKREEAQKLTQLQGKAVEALGLLKTVVDELSPVDLEAHSPQARSLRVRLN